MGNVSEKKEAKNWETGKSTKFLRLSTFFLFLLFDNDFVEIAGSEE